MELRGFGMRVEVTGNIGRKQGFGAVSLERRPGARAMPGRVALFMLAVSGPCAAASTSGEGLDPNRYIVYSLAELMAEPVFTPTKSDKPYAETPARLHLITRQQIRTRGYRNLVDLLADIPGIHVQRGGEESRYNDITIRGNFEHRRFVILRDGVRIDAPTGEMMQVADNFPLYHAEQVEVMMGPASSLYGTDAFGAVINIRTRGGGEIDGGALGTRIGTDGYRYSHFLAGKEIAESWSLAMGGHLHETGGLRLIDDYPSLFPRTPAMAWATEVIAENAREDYQAPTESEGLFARVNYGELLELGYQHAAFRYSSSVGVRPDSTRYTADAVIHSVMDTVYLKLKYTLGDDLEALTSIDYSLHKLDPESNFQNKYSNFEKGYKYFEGRRAGIEQQINWRFDDDQVITAGLVYQDYYSLPRTADMPAPYNTALPPDAQGMFHPNTDDTIPIEFLDFDYRNLAGYLQWQRDWSDRLYTMAGLRYDRHSEFGPSWNPRLGLMYQLDGDDKVRLSYSEAFRAPSFSESHLMYGNFSRSAGASPPYTSSFFRIPNHDLAPEKLRTLELGFERLFPGGRLNLDLYVTEVNDMIFSKPHDTPVQFFDAALMLETHTAVNAGNARMHGLDISVEYQRKLSADLMMETWGDYSYIDGYLRYPIGGERVHTDLQYAATHKIGAGITLNYNGRIFLTPKLRIVSPTMTKQASAGFPRSPGYAVVDLHAGVRNLFGVSGLAVELDILNLLDKRYYNAGGVASDHNFERNPQPRGSFFLSISYDL